MSQLAELERVKARIRALVEKTVSNGCTEPEALAAAEMVGRLLERYALSMDEIEVRESRCVQRSVLARGKQRRPIDGCVPAIAQFCDCKVWLSRDESGSTYVFFGFETDTILADYLFRVIDQAIATELLLFRQGRLYLHGTVLRRATRSFQHGMAGRVAERLKAMHRERDASVARQRTDGTALVLAKQQVVEDAFGETDIRLTGGGRARQIPINQAYYQGRAAGDRVNLNRPLNERDRLRLR